MEIDEEVQLVRRQEEALQFASFSAGTAWTLGQGMRELAARDSRPVALGIWLAGQTLFYAATDGVTASNEDWLRRKRNTVLRFGRSTLRMGMELTKSGATLDGKHGLPFAEYAAHGGGFPLTLTGTGCVGAIVVSGLTQREDHALVVQAMSAVLGVAVPSLP